MKGNRNEENMKMEINEKKDKSTIGKRMKVYTFGAESENPLKVLKAL